MPYKAYMYSDVYVWDVSRFCPVLTIADDRVRVPNLSILLYGIDS